MGRPSSPFFLLRRLLHHADNAFNDIVYIGKIAFAVAVVENLDSLTVNQLVSETKIRHIRATSGTIHGEEPQTGGGDIVELRVSVCHQFVRLLVAAYRETGLSTLSSVE